MSTAKTEEIVVYQSLEPCPYLDGRTALMPLRLPMRRLQRDAFDQRMAAGDRRSGSYLYRTACPECAACQPIRVLVDEFQPSTTMRRVWKKGEQQITTHVGEAVADEARVRLFNVHRQGRNLNSERTDITIEGYSAFLTDTCCETFELSYYVGDEIIGVAVCDHGQQCVSAVYTCFDPAFSSLSPGVYSVLKEIEYCRNSNIPYLYLGLYIAESGHMNYKARYRPHERLMDGDWVRFE